MKHVQVEGLSFRDIKTLLKTGRDQGNVVFLENAIGVFKLSAKGADDLMRKIAAAGYLNYEPEVRRELPGWDITDNGLRLMLDPLMSKISRAKASALIDRVILKTEEVNNDKSSLHRIVSVKVFGSVLDKKRNEFGDVDVEITVAKRNLSAAQEKKIVSVIAEQVPQYYRDNMILSLDAEGLFDEKRVVRSISQLSPHLSVSQTAVQELGCAFVEIYTFDLARETGTKLGFEPLEIVDLTPRFECKTAKHLPKQTLFPPIGVPNDDTPFQGEGHHQVNAKTIGNYEGYLWSGRVADNGSVEPATIDADKAPEFFAGCQYLCNAWQSDCSGLDILVQALDWAASKGLDIASIDREFSLRNYPGSRIGNYGLNSHLHFFARRKADYVESYLIPEGLQHATRSAVSANYCIAMALGRMLDEIGPTKNANLEMRFNLGHMRRNRYDVLPKLKGWSTKLEKCVSNIEYDKAAMERAVKRQKRYESVLDIERFGGVIWHRSIGSDLGTTFSNGGLYHTKKNDAAFDAFIDESDAALSELPELLADIPGLERFEIAHKQSPKIVKMKPQRNEYT